MKATLMKTTLFLLTTMNVLIFCGYLHAADKVVVIPLHGKAASADSGWTDGGSVVSLADPDDRVCVGTNNCSTPPANTSKLYVESGNDNAIIGNAADSRGVYGYADSYGVYGHAGHNNGVYGHARHDNGVYGHAGHNYGVYGHADHIGVYGNAKHDNGVYGHAGHNYGVYGHADHIGVCGVADNRYGVYGYAANNYGGYFSAGSNNAIFSEGNIIIDFPYNKIRYSNGALKAFTIDHPLDPENKVLHHFSTEGPKALVIYTGTVVLDETGKSEAVLPDYFLKFARNPRIHLTAVGDHHVYLAGKVQGNAFIIGGEPETEVYWQVTAERDDPKARLERVARPVEEAKGNPGLLMSGEYISPDAYGR